MKGHSPHGLTYLKEFCQQKEKFTRGETKQTQLNSPGLCTRYWLGAAEQISHFTVAWHSSPGTQDTPSSPSPWEGAQESPGTDENGKDSLSPAVLTPRSIPQGMGIIPGLLGRCCISLFSFFPFPFSPCLQWAAGSGERGEDTSGMKYPPVQHNCHHSAPSSPHFCASSPSGAWHPRKRFCNSIFLLALVKNW